MNYFELFGFPERPVADHTAVSKKYFELQKKYHPDFFTNETEQEQEDALQVSADINKAYNTFKDPEKTIEYFLRLRGVVSTDEKYNLPPDFLMEMMELNESFEDKDSAAIQQEADDYAKTLYEEIAPLIAKENSTEPNADDLQKLKAYYYKKKYLNRILDRLDD